MFSAGNSQLPGSIFGTDTGRDDEHRPRRQGAFLGRSTLGSALGTTTTHTGELACGAGAATSRQARAGMDSDGFIRVPSPRRLGVRVPEAGRITSAPTPQTLARPPQQGPAPPPPHTPFAITPTAPSRTPYARAHAAHGSPPRDGTLASTYFCTAWTTAPAFTHVRLGTRLAAALSCASASTLAGKARRTST